jgi:hypothetical protein
MSGINMGRWVSAGIVAGVVMWLAEGGASMLYMADMEASLAAHNLSMELTAGIMATTVVVSLIAGLVLMFVYAAMRPRFGAGPKTAVIAAIALWCGGYLLSLIGYGMIGLYPGGLLMIWGAVGLAEMIIAALIGGAIYREPATA